MSQHLMWGYPANGYATYAPYPPLPGYTPTYVPPLPWRDRWMLKVAPIARPHRVIRALFAAVVGLFSMYGLPVGIYLLDLTQMSPRFIVGLLGLGLGSLFGLVLAVTIVDLPFAWRLKNLRYVVPILLHRMGRALVTALKVVFGIWAVVLVLQFLFNPPRRYW